MDLTGDNLLLDGTAAAAGVGSAQATGAEDLLRASAANTAPHSNADSTEDNSDDEEAFTRAIERTRNASLSARSAAEAAAALAARTAAMSERISSGLSATSAELALQLLEQEANAADAAAITTPVMESEPKAVAQTVEPEELPSVAAAASSPVDPPAGGDDQYLALGNREHQTAGKAPAEPEATEAVAPAAEIEQASVSPPVSGSVDADGDGTPTQVDAKAESVPTLAVVNTVAKDGPEPQEGEEEGKSENPQPVAAPFEPGRVLEPVPISQLQSSGVLADAVADVQLQPPYGHVVAATAAAVADADDERRAGAGRVKGAIAAVAVHAEDEDAPLQPQPDGGDFQTRVPDAGTAAGAAAAAAPTAGVPNPAEEADPGFSDGQPSPDPAPQSEPPQPPEYQATSDQVGPEPEAEPQPEPEPKPVSLSGQEVHAAAEQPIPPQPLPGPQEGAAWAANLGTPVITANPPAYDFPQVGDGSGGVEPPEAGRDVAMAPEMTAAAVTNGFYALAAAEAAASEAYGPDGADAGVEPSTAAAAAVAAAPEVGSQLLLDDYRIAAAAGLVSPELASLLGLAPPMADAADTGPGGEQPGAAATVGEEEEADEEGEEEAEVVEARVWDVNGLANEADPAMEAVAALPGPGPLPEPVQVPPQGLQEQSFVYVDSGEVVVDLISDGAVTEAVAAAVGTTLPSRGAADAGGVAARPASNVRRSLHDPFDARDTDEEEEGFVVEPLSETPSSYLQDQQQQGVEQLPYSQQQQPMPQYLQPAGMPAPAAAHTQQQPVAWRPPAGAGIAVAAAAGASLVAAAAAGVAAAGGAVEAVVGSRAAPAPVHPQPAGPPGASGPPPPQQHLHQGWQGPVQPLPGAPAQPPPPSSPQQQYQQPFAMPPPPPAQGAAHGSPVGPLLPTSMRPSVSPISAPGSAVRPGQPHPHQPHQQQPPHPPPGGPSQPPALPAHLGPPGPGAPRPPNPAAAGFPPGQGSGPVGLMLRVNVPYGQAPGPDGPSPQPYVQHPGGPRGPGLVQPGSPSQPRPGMPPFGPPGAGAGPRPLPPGPYPGPGGPGQMVRPGVGFPGPGPGGATMMPGGPVMIGPGGQPLQVRPPPGAPGLAGPRPPAPAPPPPPSPYPGLLYTEGRDTLGRPVVVLNTAMLPSKAKKNDVLQYVLAQLQPVVQRDYVLVVLSLAMGVKSSTVSSTWALGAYRSLAKPYRKNVKHIVLVQPSAWARALLALAQPFVSKKAAHKIKKVDNLVQVAEATAGEVKLESLGARFIREIQYGLGAPPLAGLAPPAAPGPTGPHPAAGPQPPQRPPFPAGAMGAPPQPQPRQLPPGFVPHPHQRPMMPAGMGMGAGPALGPGPYPGHPQAQLPPGPGQAGQQGPPRPPTASTAPTPVYGPGGQGPATSRIQGPPPPRPQFPQGPVGLPGAPLGAAFGPGGGGAGAGGPGGYGPPVSRQGSVARGPGPQ